ncbi:Hypothetical predicted protein [Paramuricea clavata]|uniref:Uncharacterized protein n=1 Tax=Paramuricea clavata TaxID=317549 RepID=A0A6S7J5P1_PARCT|nr:Hypothetical predicted protein [Paramuricea clavata]
MGELICNSTWETKMVESLKTSKFYLKGDYKVHIKESSDIAEHCIVYSMSDGKDTDYRKKCGHRHGIVCESCHVLSSNPTDIQTKATTANFATTDDRDEVAYMINYSKLAIESWQCHIIRSIANRRQIGMVNVDNAGCYHSAHTILSCPAIAKSVGMKIVRIDFSDPQGGKGAADRLAATCK